MHCLLPWASISWQQLRNRCSICSRDKASVWMCLHPGHEAWVLLQGAGRHSLHLQHIHLEYSCTTIYGYIIAWSTCFHSYKLAYHVNLLIDPEEVQSQVFMYQTWAWASVHVPYLPLIWLQITSRHPLQYRGGDSILYTVSHCSVLYLGNWQLKKFNIEQRG